MAASPESSSSPPPPTGSESSTPSDETPNETKDLTRQIASPLAKSMAKDLDLDLSKIRGSGPNERITKRDIEAYLSKTDTRGGKSTAEYTKVPLTSMRKTIAKRLSESTSSIPHFYLTTEIQMDQIVAFRKDINAKLSGTQEKVSINDFIIKAAALACRELGAVNSAWMGDHIREYKRVHMSVAVSTGEGLITPIVRDADTLSLLEISQRVRALAKKAKEGKLKPEEYQGGTFTLSNLGMYGIDSFTAIINPPQSAILAIGTTQARLQAEEDEEGMMRPDGLKWVQMMKVTMSCDHRVIDGVLGARWLQLLKGYLEAPATLLL